MRQDILFKNDDFVFSYRVGGILIQNDHILLQKPKDDDYTIIGGHVSSLETSSEALRREFEEELHVRIAVNRLMAIGEVFFPWGSRPCHQICLYYYVHLLGSDIPLGSCAQPGFGIPPEGVFHGYDELDNERIDLDYCWVPLSDLEKGLKVYPLELVPYLITPQKETVHFISREIIP